MMSIVLITPYEQGNLLSLRPTDTWRNGQVVRLTTVVQRIIYWIKELFAGGKGNNDRKNFDYFYNRIKGNIQILNDDLSHNRNLSETFHAIQTMLHISAKIANSSWAKSFGADYKTYQNYKDSLERLRKQAERKVELWAQDDIVNRLDTARWIRASETQRRFAAFMNHKQVPYRFNEIPRGAVILTDPFLYIQSTQLKKKGSIFKTIFLHAKAFLCWAATGKRYTHAELSLGKGEAFDLAKKEDGWMMGEMKIQSRGDSTCYGAIVAPNEEKMLLAHQRAYREKGFVPYETFDTLWAAIDQEARRSVPLIKASVCDLARVGLASERKADYDPMQAWSPGKKAYGCSATVSALFSKFGIDIGAQFRKKNQNVSPANFFSSHFFRPFYLAES